MSVIMKIRQARNVEQIAEELEPLAVSLATLADQAQESIKNMETASFRQSQEWSIQQENVSMKFEVTVESVREHVAALQQATANLREVATVIAQIRSSQFWNLFVVAGIAGILASGLAVGFWLWLGPSPLVQMDAQNIAEILKPSIQEVLRPAPPPPPPVKGKR